MPSSGSVGQAPASAPDSRSLDGNWQSSVIAGKEGAETEPFGDESEKKPCEKLEVLPFPPLRSFEEGILALILPVRDGFANLKMAALNMAFPGAFDATEFNAGVSEAFKLVHAALCEGNRDLLHDLLDEQLLREVFEDQPAIMDNIAKTRYELHDSEFLGVLSAWPVPLDHGYGDGVLKVEALFSAEEDAVVEMPAGAEKSETVRYRQKRLHTWTFERPLLDGVEQSEEWRLVAMDKLVWPPTSFPPETGCAL